MDPITHLITTRKLVSKKPIIMIAGIAADLPFYLNYPAWVMTKGNLKNAAQNKDWPKPPSWIETTHHVFHSIPVVTVVFILTRIIKKQLPINVFKAWLLHILIDLPTHSRKQWGPRFLWPFSDYAMDGISWVDILYRIRQLHKSKEST